MGEGLDEKLGEVENRTVVRQGILRKGVLGYLSVEFDGATKNNKDIAKKAMEMGYDKNNPVKCKIIIEPPKK